MPEVSVIIPCYNGARWLSEAIESVLAQTYTDYEIIVVDDGSTDNSAEIAHRYTLQVKYCYQTHKGLSTALNLGIRVATGSYIAFLDADDLWLPRKVELQVELLENQPDLGLVYSSAYAIDSEGTIIKMHKSKRYTADDLGELFIAGNSIRKSTVMVKRECFDSVGFFDEALLFTEDYDMWLRLAKHFRFSYISLPLAKVRSHGENWAAKEGNWQYNIILTDKICSLFPELEFLRKRRLSWVHLGYGRYYLFNNLHTEARQEFKKAIQYRPYSFLPYIFLLLSYLPRQAVVYLRAAKSLTMSVVRRTSFCRQPCILLRGMIKGIQQSARADIP